MKFGLTDSPLPVIKKKAHRWMVDRGLLLPTVTKLSAGSNGRVACSGKRVNPKHGGLCLLEYDTKSDFLHMDAQKDAQAIYKVLKIKGYISPMLHKNH